MGMLHRYALNRNRSAQGHCVDLVCVSSRRYKFLLNLDGFTAAYRFSKLMLINSPILKEESGRGEYYYRWGKRLGTHDN